MLATTSPISYRQLPLRLFQIGPKFRDELKTRFGLMRAKEFLMKDMYSFDVSEETAMETYTVVNAAYDRLFKQLEVPFVKGKYNFRTEKNCITNIEFIYSECRHWHNGWQCIPRIPLCIARGRGQPTAVQFLRLCWQL